MPEPPTSAPHLADTVLADEWWAMAAELIKSAVALENHAAALRERARIAAERAQLIDGQGVAE
jgi:hypothetical protein